MKIPGDGSPAIRMDTEHKADKRGKVYEEGASSLLNYFLLSGYRRNKYNEKKKEQDYEICIYDHGKV